MTGALVMTMNESYVDVHLMSELRVCHFITGALIICMTFDLSNVELLVKGRRARGQG